ncbi:MAG TPA: EAL domain-containing protein [Myxococcota bacterium]|nr:EAL domain-containing protein [Myxococcota bacterium]
MPDPGKRGAASQIRRVLVVDDDPVMRMVATRCLTAMKFQVAEAQNGRDAIERVLRDRPSLVLLDLEMPGMDGFETCAELRRLLSQRQLAILVVTGRSDKATIDRAFEAGATDFVSKPLDWSLLQHRVRFLMRAHAALDELRGSEQRLANAQRLARIGDWEWQPGESEMLWSAQLYDTLGVTPGVAPTLDMLLAAVHPSDRAAVEKALLGAREDGQGFSLDHRVVTPDGEERIVRQDVEVRRALAGTTECLTGTLQDITAVRVAEERVRYLAHYDSLTALPNRRLLVEHLERSLAHARKHGDTLALLYVDIDRFKRINDSLGHDVGDRVLREVSERMLGCVRSTDFVSRSEISDPLISRLGGDEFSVVLRRIRSGDDAGIAARRILEALSAPFIANHAEVTLRGSVGIALFPGDGEDPETLLRNAEAAIAEAKARGGATYQFFREAMNEGSWRALRIETLLRGAIRSGELTLAYQPQLEVASGRLVAVEALARWHSAELGDVTPSEFVPVAEKSGLIGELGAWALREACGQLAAWRANGDPMLPISVNVSSRQLYDPDFPEKVTAVLREMQLETSWLEFEITESALLVDETSAAATLAHLRGLGIRLALDDFGTGYSSLSHVVRLPIDVIKIDHSFVADLGSANRGSAIVAAVVALGRKLGLRVTAEGVETTEQRRALEALGCDVLQGFHIAHPMSADALRKLLLSR